MLAAQPQANATPLATLADSATVNGGTDAAYIPQAIQAAHSSRSSAVRTLARTLLILYTHSTPPNQRAFTQPLLVLLSRYLAPPAGQAVAVAQLGEVASIYVYIALQLERGGGMPQHAQRAVPEDFPERVSMLDQIIQRVFTNELKSNQREWIDNTLALLQVRPVGRKCGRGAIACERIKRIQAASPVGLCVGATPKACGWSFETANAAYIAQAIPRLWPWSVAFLDHQTPHSSPCKRLGGETRRSQDARPWATTADVRPGLIGLYGWR